MSVSANAIQIKNWLQLCIPRTFPEIPWKMRNNHSFLLRKPFGLSPKIGDLCADFYSIINNFVRWAVCWCAR